MRTKCCATSSLVRMLRGTAGLLRRASAELRGAGWSRGATGPNRGLLNRALARRRTGLTRSGGEQALRVGRAGKGSAVGSRPSYGAVGEDGAVRLTCSLFRLRLQPHPTGTCRAPSPRPCRQRISCRPCTRSQPSCSAWPWNSSSGFTPTTLCTACRSRRRRITTGARTRSLRGAGPADRSVLASTLRRWRRRWGRGSVAPEAGDAARARAWEQGCLATGARRWVGLATGKVVLGKRLLGG